MPRHNSIIILASLCDTSRSIPLLITSKYLGYQLPIQLWAGQKRAISMLSMLSRLLFGKWNMRRRMLSWFCYKWIILSTNLSIASNI